MGCSDPKPGPGSGLLGAPRRGARLRPEVIPSVPENPNTPLSGPRRGAPSRGTCPPELGPVAHKTAGSGFERRTPARRAKAREGFRKRVFEIDMEQCPHCGGTLKIIAAIEHPPVITKILTYLGLPARVPPRAAARGFDRFQLAF